MKKLSLLCGLVFLFVFIFTSSGAYADVPEHPAFLAQNSLWAQADSTDTEVDDEDEYDDDNIEETVPQFTPGQLVRHDTFGLGRVKEYIDMGENSVVVIDFNTGQIKSLIVKYADLSKVDI